MLSRWYDAKSVKGRKTMAIELRTTTATTKKHISSKEHMNKISSSLLE